MGLMSTLHALACSMTKMAISFLLESKSIKAALMLEVSLPRSTILSIEGERKMWYVCASNQSGSCGLGSLHLGLHPWDSTRYY